MTTISVSSTNHLASSLPGLSALGAELTQAWRAITQPNQAWASAAEISAHHDLDALLEFAAHGHRLGALMAQNYTTVGLRLLDTDHVRIPAKLAQQYTGKPAATRLVPVPREYVDRTTIAQQGLTRATDAARNALDTAVFFSPAAMSARARLPLGMSSADLDRAIRQRVETLHHQREHRSTQQDARQAHR